MAAQLLWIEFILKLAVGAGLVIAPRSVIRIFGLPRLGPAASAFWPRLAGALLVGIAGASFIEGALGSHAGLGLAGSAVINGILAALIVLVLAVDPESVRRRGRTMLWLLALALATISVLEIGYGSSAPPPPALSP